LQSRVFEVDHEVKGHCGANRPRLAG
jgi:hypothetical protein